MAFEPYDRAPRLSQLAEEYFAPLLTWWRRRRTEAAVLRALRDYIRRPGAVSLVFMRAIGDQPDRVMLRVRDRSLGLKMRAILFDDRRDAIVETFIERLTPQCPVCASNNPAWSKIPNVRPLQRVEPADPFPTTGAWTRLREEPVD